MAVSDLFYFYLICSYDSTTGQFTVPSGGAGLYFLYTNFYGDDRKHMDFFIRVNGTNLCAAFADMHSSGVDDNGTPSCGAVAQLAVGWLIMLFLLLMTLTCQWRIYIAKFCMGPQSNFLHFHAVSGKI